MSDNQRWRGFIDYIDEPLVVGWAFDACNPNLPILVRIAAGGGRQMLIRANIFRQDLKDHGIGDGRHGFVANLRDFSALDGPIEIAILFSNCVLTQDLHLDSWSLRNATPPIPDTFHDLMTVLAAELQVAKH